MEMVQFLPCVLTDPPIWRGIQFPWLVGPQSGIRAWLLNRFGERFMEKWDPVNMEFSTRDFVAIACMKEVLEGRGGPNGGVFLSWAHLPSNIIDFSADWYFRTHLRGNWRWEGFDFSGFIADIKQGRAVEVNSASHFFMGGVRDRPRRRDRRAGPVRGGRGRGRGPWRQPAVGQCGNADTCPGSASRSGGSGLRAAESADGRRRESAWGRAREDLEAPLMRDSGVLPFEIKDELQELANVKVGIVRTRESLEEALDARSAGCAPRGIAQALLPGQGAPVQQGMGGRRSSAAA